MFRTLLERIRREVSGERALASVRTLAGFHRVQSSPGYDAAAAWVGERLAAAGLEVETEEVPGDGRTRLLGQLMPQAWACSRAVAVLIEGDRREPLCDGTRDPLSLVLRSAPARGTFVLVDVGEGVEPEHYQHVEVSGRVVLASGDVHRVLELAVMERGAAGILTDTRRLLDPVRGPEDETDALNYTSFWWDGDEPRGWGLVVPPRVARRLRSRLAGGARLEVEVLIEARAYDAPIPLLSARLGEATRDEVVLVSHLCHPRPSANDNASGAAANLEAARALAALHAAGELGPLRRAMRFLWVPELTGSYAYLARDPARPRRIAAALNLDMVGEDQAKCGSTFLLERPPCFAASFAEDLVAAIRGEAVDWVTSYSGPGHYSMVRMAEVPYGGGSDHALFVDPALGVPCPLLIQWPDRFYHSSHDTPDKTDPASLALATRCAATYAGFLATAGEAEIAWIGEAVGRAARARVLEALGESDRVRGVARERLRGRTALASLARLGVARPATEAAGEAFEQFVRREAGPTDATPNTGTRSPHGPIPRRLLAAPLGFPRRLMPGWRDLPRDERERWRRLELDTTDATVLAELSWFACDGTRDLDAIAHLAWLETGREAVTFIAAFFDLTARLGLSEWAPKEGACNPSAPNTAGS